MSNTIYLQHYGILGQKWGVRRFQNPDGTYTSEGKRRRNSNGNSDSSATSSSRDRKKNRKIAAAGAIGAAAAVGGIAAYNTSKNKNVGQVNKRASLNDWFEPKIKGGKDKPPISKAEKVSKESEKAFGGIEKLVSFTEKRIKADEINKRNKEIEKMTDDDLRKKTNRLNLETNYIDAINKRETANGKIAATDIINAVGGSLAIIGGVVGIATAIKTK